MYKVNVQPTWHNFGPSLKVASWAINGVFYHEATSANGSVTGGWKYEAS